MINTLIFAIMKNYVGNPTGYQERNWEILLNLTCRKLQEFRWYKDLFLTKVMNRIDCKQAYWKERFIAGLPKLFAQGARNKFRADYDNIIPYKDLAYGELINYINQEGLAICLDLKLKSKFKKDNIYNKDELGSFCQQYGYESIKLPSSTSKKRKINFRENKYRR